MLDELLAMRIVSLAEGACVRPYHCSTQRMMQDGKQKAACLWRSVHRADQVGVVAFVVDDDAGEVLTYAVTYGGADWIRRTGARSR